MLMSIATLEGAPAGIIPAHLEQARYLMIVEMDTHECLEVLDGRKKQKPDVFFARMTVNRNCEAIICGDIRKEAFDILSEAQVTRYNGAALQAQEIRKRVMTNNLPLIRDCREGEGCPSHGDPDGTGECRDHSHDHDHH